MNTSYFSKYRNKPNGVSIALYPPKGFTGRFYPQLAPPNWLFVKFKDACLHGETESAQLMYIEAYQKEILDKLNPQQVYDELGDDAVLLCYEKAGSFCHRRLVADWLEKHLNITISEIG